VPSIFVVAAEVLGDAKVKAWVSGVAAAQLRHPLLRVSVEYGPDGPACFREHANIPIPLRIVPEEEFAAWQVEMAKELAAPIPFSGGPTRTCHPPATEWWIIVGNPSLIGFFPVCPSYDRNRLAAMKLRQGWGIPKFVLVPGGIRAKGDTPVTSSDEIEFPSLLLCGFCKNLLRVAWLPF
jgi:hypothetical protein